MYTSCLSSLHLRNVIEARQRIAGHVCRTPSVPAYSLCRPNRRVSLKLETAQPVGAFKLRGAANAIARLSPEDRAKGVVCASTGNHGRALAFAAAAAGMRAHVCMSRLAPQNKVEAIRTLGAVVHIVGESQDDAQREVDRLALESGMVEVPPFDHPDVIAGQGTIGVEILEDEPDVDTIVVPLSGGGLVGGVALAAKAIDPTIRIVAVSPRRGAAMHASIAAGRPVEVREEPTLADSLGGGVGLANRYTFSLVRDLVDEIALLDEDQIAGAMRALFLEGWVAEGAGAVGVAPLLWPGLATLGERVVVVVSGRNVDMRQFLRAVAEPSMGA